MAQAVMIGQGTPERVQMWAAVDSQMDRGPSGRIQGGVTTRDLDPVSRHPMAGYP